ncbi:unnamed protein product [Rhizophagus irregularis]|uniref:RNase H type-1 domain-containing protein n=1 Tax=Rhizophagus irregularis TaxID=588596 RepID=A0A2N1NP15_9GLOM|nr:hypothetical protein RhiirC2_773400 [Rhizophagus irregularis]CAB4376761.1 unnamed protein product [Rhizophagus irregularis]CAB5360223.1 unnamed protein product [Rhizophagus irregularis]
MDPNTNSCRTIMKQYQAIDAYDPNIASLTPTLPSNDGRRKEWIITREKGEYQYDNGNLLTQCNSCSTNMNHSDNNTSCLKKGKHHKSAVIDVKRTTNNQQSSIVYEIITPVDMLKKRTISHLSMYENERPLLLIDISSQDLDIINRNVSSPLLITELSDILNVLEHHDEQKFHFYTDGSMDLNCLDNEYVVVMGAGWIIKNSNISFSCRVRFYPSSTRPELLAILTALLAAPNKSHVHIHTNSQAAIDGINKISNMTSQHDRRFLKLNNYIILFAIIDIVKTKRITFEMHKVKGHSGCY